MTVRLTEWVPPLAQEIFGRKYGPNHDFVVHLQCQQLARELDIRWAMEMPAAEVEQLTAAIRDMYGK